jgi:tetratricopeptide (TPR) repeat protein
MQERIDEALNDPKKDLEFVLGYVPLSAEATIEYLDENSPQTRRPYVPNVESLKKIVTESPEEYNTRIRLKWLPEEDRVWHRVTPFIIYLEHMSWERWLIEAEFLNRVKKDNKRAYIANREAFRVKPDDANVVIGYGWSAFRCRRLKEAIEVTKLSLNDERNYIQFMANINMGLYYLDMAASNDDEEAVNLDASKTHYEKAIQLLNSLEIKEKTIGVHAAIEDILEYRTQLHTKSEHYLKMFQEYEQSN